MELPAFVEKYPPRGPLKPPANEDELRLLTAGDGLVVLDGAPFVDPVPGRPGTPEGRYLWVIVPVELRAALERASVQPQLESGVAKHTNLTGGEPACCGGELWVDAVEANFLFVNGGSGRYRPETVEHLNDAVGVFQALGFRVRSAGWDPDNDEAARTFR